MTETGLAGIVAFGRTGIRIFWSTDERTTPRLRLSEAGPVAVLILLCIALAAGAGPVSAYLDEAARSLDQPAQYIDAVLSADTQRDTLWDEHAAIAEAIGMTLPGASSIPAADVNHMRMSAECGRRVVEMVWDDLTPQRILTLASFKNAINVAMAMGCSTNAIIHLVAMSRRAGHPVGLDDFDAASRKVPVIANIRPSGDKYLMEDFFYAGGLPALMSRLEGHLDLSAMTVTGKTLGENIAGAEVYNDVRAHLRHLDRDPAAADRGERIAKMVASPSLPMTNGRMPSGSRQATSPSGVRQSRE